MVAGCTPRLLSHFWNPRSSDITRPKFQTQNSGGSDCRILPQKWRTYHGTPVGWVHYQNNRARLCNEPLPFPARKVFRCFATAAQKNKAVWGEPAIISMAAGSLYNCPTIILEHIYVYTVATLAIEKKIQVSGAPNLFASLFARRNSSGSPQRF